MKKIVKKAISIFLAASIAFQLAVSTYAEAGVEFFGDDSLGEEISSSEENVEERTLIGEIKEKRSEYTKHFLYSDGTIVAAQYHAAVHYLDENGEWQEIDNSLVSQAATKDEDDFAGFTNKSNDFKVKFSNGNASGKFFKYEKERYGWLIQKSL